MVTRPKWSSAGSFPYYICTLLYDFILDLIYIFRDYCICKFIWEKQTNKYSYK